MSAPGTHEKFSCLDVQSVLRLWKYFYLKGYYNIMFWVIVLWIILMYPLSNTYAQQNKSDANVSAVSKEIEEILREDKSLIRLASGLKLVYHYIMKHFSATHHISKSQAEWLKKREIECTGDCDTYYLLKCYYSQRIAHLVRLVHKNNKVRDYFLKNFFITSGASNEVAFLASLASLCHDKFNGDSSFDEYVAVEYLEDPIIIPFDKQKFIVALKVSQAPVHFRKTYELLLLEQKKTTIDVERYNLPLPTKESLPEPHCLFGDLDLEKKGDAYYLTWCFKKEKYEIIYFVTWKIQNGNCQVVDEGSSNMFGK